MTDAVCRALTGGDAEISFEISIPTAAKNNYAGIHSSRTVKEGAQKPSLKWEPDYVPERIIKKNLNYIIDLASNIKPEDYTNVDEISLAQMIDEGKQILLDPDAEMEEIHEMERRLTREMVKYRRRF